MSDDWAVKLPGRIRPAIEKIAQEEFIPAPDVVRAIVQRAVFQRELEKARQMREQTKTT
jgi:hypothetical protein